MRQFIISLLIRLSERALRFLKIKEKITPVQYQTPVKYIPKEYCIPCSKTEIKETGGVVKDALKFTGYVEVSDFDHMMKLQIKRYHHELKHPRKPGSLALPPFISNN
jgi:hypothetical protein